MTEPCQAQGCPCAGTVYDRKQGIYLCRFHYRLEPRLWQPMTNRLNDFLWLLKITKWIREESYRYQDEKIIDRIRRAVKCVDVLLPREGESPQLWQARAEHWLDTPVRIGRI